MTNEAPEQFGPTYPAIPSAAKYRRMADAAGGVAAMDVWHRHAYGQAVENAIRALNKRQSGYKTATPNCASGTFHNTAEAIEKAVRSQNIANIRAAAKRDREGRTDAQNLVLPA